MRNYTLLTLLAICLAGGTLWAAPMGPTVPDLNLPAEQEEGDSPSRPVVVYKSVANLPQRATSRPTSASRARAAAATTDASLPSGEVIAITNATINKGEYVEKVIPDESKLTPLPSLSDFEAAEEERAKQELARDEAKAAVPVRQLRVVYNPVSDRDPTLSPDDSLLMRDKKEKERRRAEQERKQRLEAERRRIAAIERQRREELERLRDPSREVRDKIKINGIIGKEVFIGNKVYTVGKTYMGARIVAVQPDGVVFLYKGQKFTKKVKLQ